MAEGPVPPEKPEGRPGPRGRSTAAQPPKTSGQNQQPDEPYSEMAIAAQEAVVDPAITATTTHTPVSPNAKVEIYEDETRLNKRANREMRKLAFYVVGGLSGVYVLVLLCVLWRFFDGRLLASILGAPGGHLDWHMLVLIGIALVIFAAIPLSLTMALMKMISEATTDSEGSDFKTPNTELGKVLLELFKSMLAASKAS